MSVKNELVWWNYDFNDMMKKWLVDNAPDLVDKFNNTTLKEKQIQWEGGMNSYGTRVASYQHLIDRERKINLYYNTTPNIKWIPFQEWPQKLFSECVFESAKSIADKGKTIDLFWSGGLDSNLMLIAFNELGLHKQLRVIMGGPPETPYLFDKIIKGRIDYVLDETETLSNTYSLAKPDQHVFVAGSEADPLFGAKGTLTTFENTDTDLFNQWNTKRRFVSCNRIFRFISNYQGDKIDVDNQKSFFHHPEIEKFAINKVLSNEMVYYDLTHEGWGHKNVWHLNAGYNDDAESQKHYLKCKMPLRDFVYDFTKNKDISYDMKKGVSEFRMRFVKSNKVTFKENFLRVIAITDDGNIISRENFYEYDWTRYIADT